MSCVHSGKIVVVTGSSRGIGKAIALRFAREGADVLVCARTEQPDSHLSGSIGETAAAIQVMGRRAVAIRMDVANDRDIDELIPTIAKEFGRVDILVNNAALAGLAGPGKPFLQDDAKLLDSFYRTNVRAPYLISRKIGELMSSSGGGAIVNISSRMGQLPHTAAVRRGGRGVHMGYAISKAALDRFSAAIAEELSAHKISVITVYPGLTKLERLSHRPELYPPSAESPDVTAKAVSYLCQNPRAYTGRFFLSGEVVREHGL